MMKRDLRDAVCKTLLDNVGRGFLWDGSAPSPEVRRLLEDDLSPVSLDDRIVLATVLAIWDGVPGPSVRDILQAAPLQAELVGSLLAAAAKGGDTLELWIRQNQTTNDQGPGDARLDGAGSRPIGANIRS